MLLYLKYRPAKIVIIVEKLALINLYLSLWVQSISNCQAVKCFAKKI